jgi:hypothetical protein
VTLPSNWNPLFSKSVRLGFPSSLHEKATNLCRRSKDESGQSRLPQNSPFERMVDLWMLCLIIGKSESRFEPDVELKDFIGADIFHGDMARISIALAIALAHEKNDISVLEDAKRCLMICNGYAAGGLPIILGAADSGASTTIENIYKSITSGDLSF